MTKQLIKLFQDYLTDWSWDEWQAAGSSDREEVVVNAIADIGPTIDVEEAYDIFYDWAAGLTEADFTEESLTEDADHYSSKIFWAAAKDNRLADRSFHRAYDDELEELGLMDLFDADGILTGSGVYGRIKQAKEANPDSWAVRALLKMWVLQFKDGVKPASVIDREEQEAKQARVDAKVAAQKAEWQKAHDAAKKDWYILDANFDTIKDIVSNTINEYVISKKAMLKPDLEKAVKLKAEIVAATQGIVEFYDNTDRTLALLDKEDKLVEFSVAHEAESPDRITWATIIVRVPTLFGVKTSYDNYIERIQVKDLQNNTIKSKIIAMLDNIWEDVSNINTLYKIQKQHNEVMTKVNAAKAAQAAVDSGRPVDPSFIAGILAELSKGKNAADDAYRSWADSTDGSYGAAYAMKEDETLRSVGVSLVNCNWRALANGKEIAAWRTTDSIDDLADELKAAFKASGNNLTIEIVK